MYRHIEQLRRAPDHQKNRVAFIGAGAVTLMLFVAWLSVIMPSNTTAIVAEQSSQTPAASQAGNTPVESLERSVAQVYDAVKNLYQTTVMQVNLQEDYTKMKTQVQTGQIQLAPQNPGGPQ